MNKENEMEYLKIDKRIYEIKNLPCIKIPPENIKRFIRGLKERFRRDILNGSCKEFDWIVNIGEEIDFVQVTIPEDKVTKENLKEINQFDEYLRNEYNRIRYLYQDLEWLGVIKNEEKK